MKRERGRIQSCLFVGAAFQRFRASKNMSFWRNKIPRNTFMVNYIKKSGNFLWPQFFLFLNCQMLWISTNVLHDDKSTIFDNCHRFFWQFKLNATTFFLWPDFCHIFTTQHTAAAYWSISSWKVAFYFCSKETFFPRKTLCALFWHIKVFRPKAGGVWCVFLSFSLWKIVAFLTTYQGNICTIYNIITTQKLVASHQVSCKKYSYLYLSRYWIMHIFTSTSFPIKSKA